MSHFFFFFFLSSSSNHSPANLVCSCSTSTEQIEYLGTDAVSYLNDATIGDLLEEKKTSYSDILRVDETVSLLDALKVRLCCSVFVVLLFCRLYFPSLITHNII